MSLMSLGLVRGIVAQIVGIVIGMILVTVGRFVIGLSPVWAAEPAWVGGAIVGAIAFMIGVGALDDWFLWMRGIETPTASRTAGRQARLDSLFRC